MPPKDAKGKGGAAAVFEPPADLPTQLQTAFPTWNAATVDAAIKAQPAGDYEDEDGLMLPPFLAQFVDAWKRPTQMSSSGPMPVMALRELTEQEAAEAAAKGGGAKGGKGGAPADGAPAMRDMAPGAAMAAGHECNEWLLYSMLNVYKSRSQVAPNDFLWENVWPKGPDGQPCASPSGKYWIRMWVMNEWRMVVVDDRVPVDVFGSPLLVNVSRPVMLWPLLYTKAVFKLMHAYRCLEIARPDQVPVIPWITGWVREALDQTVMPADAFKLFDRIEWGVLAPGATVTTMLHTRAPKKRKPPRLMVIYGPSAVGRGGVLRKLFADYPDKFEMCVSHTTRPPRAHEVDGEHYHFRTKEEVERMQAEGLMLELQTVNGYLYGTSLPAVQKVVAGGRFPVVSIDAQGVKAMQAQTGKYKIDTLYVHVVPPSMEVLQQRMEGRLKEHEITINKRIAFAQSEMDKAEEKPDQFENILDHFADDSWPAMDKVYYDLKVAISVLSPVIRNRLRGLPDYVLDYSDVIPSNTVEKMHPMPVVIAGPSLGLPGSKERMMAMLFEEFEDVFGQVTVYTTMAPGAFGCGEVEDYPAHYKHCTAEEFEEKKADAYVTWRDTFKHEMLTYDYCITKQEIERINGEVRLSVVLTDLEGVAQIKATKVPSMFLFIAPENIELFKTRLFADLHETEQRIKLMMIDAGRAIKAMRPVSDVELLNDDVDKCNELLKDTISEFRPDVIYRGEEEIEKCLSPIVVCGPPGVGKSTLIAALVAKHPDVLTTCLPYLSREPAKGETNGEKFHFVKKEQFEAYQAQEGFFFSVAPAAEAGLMLGYSFESIRDASRKGKVTVVETEEADVAAALQTKVAAGLVDEVVCIFVQPDREEAIVERLKARAAADPKNVTATEEDCEALRKRCAAVTAAALTPTQGDALFAQHVLRNDTLEDCLTLLHDAVSQHHPTLVPPFVPPLVISGPYGSGKRTMCVRLLEEFADSSFGFAVNTTTRAPEEGEVDGEHFHFVTKQKFKEGIQAGLFLEWVDMEGVLHGMTWASVRAVQASGQMCIIDSDVESAAAMRDAGFKAVYLYFSLPPLHVLKERLAADGLEEKDVAKRVKAGKEETKLFEKHSHVFDLVLANEEEEVCYVKLKEHLHTISPSTVPISAVWGFGHPLWEPSLRKYAHRPLKVSILGAALSGKTTLSFMLSKRYDVPVISTGSLLRDAAYDNPTEIGIKAKEYLDGSKTVPDEFMVILAKKRIAQDDCVRKGYIFDGFPRTPAQVEMLTEANILLDKVVFVECTYATLFSRVQGRKLDPDTGMSFHDTAAHHTVAESTVVTRKKEQKRIKGRLTVRYDDNEENIQNRIDIYRKLLPHLKKLLITCSTYVDGGRPSEQVFADIESFLRVEEKFLLPANVIHVTPVNTLTEVDYHVIETVKFCRKLLLRIHDLLPFERTVYWVELDDLVKHTHCVLLNYRQQDFTATHAVDYLNMNRAPPSMLLRVDSPEPTELLVSLSIAPPEPPLQSASPALVLVGPSGAGKSTLIKMLTDEFPQRFGFSVSHTTRGPREGEAEGVAYHFSEREAMQAMIDNGEFLEHAEVHGHLYGTSKAAVEAVSQAGRVCILDIDVKGARQVKAAGVPARFIFISPPSLAVLERRLKERGTESAEAVATRMRNAAEEMEAVFYPGFFDRVLLNTELDATYATFREVVLTPAERGEPRTCQLLGESFDWQRALPGYHNLNLDTRSTDATMITLPRGVSTLRLTVDRGFYFSAVFRSLTPLVVDKAADVLSKYDQVATHEAEGAYTEHVGGTFNLWMRQTFAIKQATTLAANFHLASVDAVPYLRLALVDNDTGSSTPYMLGRLAATTLQPNEEGYTLLAYARPPMTLPAAAWALLVAADKPVGDFTTASLHETRRVEGTYAPNRHAVVTRQRVSAGAAQQLSLHVETYKECTFVVTLRKAATAESPEEETVRSWQVLRSLTLPAVKLPALPMGSEKGAPQPTYILDVRLVPEACYFTIEHNGDIPMQLDWQVAVASTVPVEVTADDTQQKEFQAIIDGWNARDPKGRADAAKAALQRMTEEAETGEVAWAKSRTGRDDTVVPLQPTKHHVVRYGVADDVVLTAADYEARAAAVTAAVEEDARAVEAMRAARVAAHHDRLAATNAHKKEFADWRQQFVSELDEIVQARDDYANTMAAVQALRRPPLEAEDSQPKGVGKKAGGGKGDKGAEEESAESKELAMLTETMGLVKNMLSGLKAGALAELRGYRNAPTHSGCVLQAVLAVLGRSPQEAKDWEACRRLITRGLVVQLAACDPVQQQQSMQTDAAMWAHVDRLLEHVDEDAVIKESIASAVLYRWVLSASKLAKAAAAAAAAAPVDA